MRNSSFLRAYGFWHWGEGLQTVLFTWYMAFHVGLPASQIGFYQALVLSPFLLFTIAGGILTDRIGARRSFRAATVLFGLLLIGYGVLDHVFGFVPVLFFAYCLAAGVVSAVSNPAIDTFIPDATPRRAQENALLAANAHNMAKLAGNLTGLTLPLLHAVGGFGVNGLLMLASAASLRPVQPATRQGAPEPELSERPSLRRLWAHFRECPENFDILLSSAMLGLLVVPVGYILLPLALRANFPGYGDLLAVMTVSSWLGAIAATWAIGRLSRRIGHPGRIALLVWGGYACALVTLPLVPGFAWLCVLVAVLGMVKLGKAMVYGKYIRNCPDTLRGSVIAVEQTAFWGLATLGTFLLGWLVDLIGLVPTIHLVALSVGLAALALALRGRLSGLTPAL
ncbi:MFS transporter [Ruegeria pomeroyi]|uniref:Membrane protein n=2 Tax=Ruegeria pomeroyi TaxID=89184 RepID=Q5LWB8_RUEPO|nr:MFS transporter [Ruegeria pomeroyi]HCE71385.1 MFS transporter [Ruegeria sp.]AAV93742.1 membrane protein [Ruegeria pomeroyi DSS-3]NVK98598.1 MFS transporter [Ruegeria pomeroyi]NVL01795.1 MFS transporter [Ruegeria pomeroyi]QWV07333.1 MFS transporter [Ruegeria pomeroyi]